jgi:hypothetical protein
MEVFGAIRGRSFTNSIIIIDEFQNISHDNAKTFLTRFQTTQRQSSLEIAAKLILMLTLTFFLSCGESPYSSVTKSTRFAR